MKRRLPCLACGRMLAVFEFCERADCPAYLPEGPERAPEQVSTAVRVDSRPPSITTIKPRLFED